VLSIALLGCFPHNEKARTYSKLVEGGLIAAGIGVEVLANAHTGADCDMMSGGAVSYSASCHTTSTIYGGVGLAMIIAGLTGFIATVSTAEDSKPEPPPVDIKAQEKPHLKLPPGVQPPPPGAQPPAATPSGSADAPTKPAP
jgi:hypothetical protein